MYKKKVLFRGSFRKFIFIRQHVLIRYKILNMPLNKKRKGGREKREDCQQKREGAQKGVNMKSAERRGWEGE